MFGIKTVGVTDDEDIWQMNVFHFAIGSASPRETRIS